MRKLLAAALIAGATFSVGLAQGTTTASTSQSTQDIPNMGQAPKAKNGIGRLDLRVIDQNGNPIKGAFAKLESRRTDGFFCESRDYTDAQKKPSVRRDSSLAKAPLMDCRFDL